MKNIGKAIKNFFKDIKEMILWIKNKEEIEEQIRIDTHKIDLQQIEISKLKHKLEKEGKEWIFG